MKRNLVLSICAALSVLLVSACSGGPAPVEEPGPGPGPQQPAAPEAPRIVSIASEGTSVSVTAQDANGDDITLSAVAPSGLQASPPSRLIAGGGPATVEFAFIALDPLAGAPGGEASITASDGLLSSESRSVAVNESAPLAFADDTLYAFPLDTTVEVGEPVTIVIATGDPGTPIYSPSVRVGMNMDWDYVPNSFNLGEPGGAFDELDGIYSPWPDNSPLLLPGELLYDVWHDTQGADELYCIDFTCWPLEESGVTPLSEGGMLFNFQAVFSEPGEYTLDFFEYIAVGHMPGNEVTCIIPGPASTERILWGDVSNDHAGLITTITVTE